MGENDVVIDAKLNPADAAKGVDDLLDKFREMGEQVDHIATTASSGFDTLNFAAMGASAAVGALAGFFGDCVFEAIKLRDAAGEFSDLQASVDRLSDSFKTLKGTIGEAIVGQVIEGKGYLESMINVLNDIVKGSAGGAGKQDNPTGNKLGYFEGLNFSPLNPSSYGLTDTEREKIRAEEAQRREDDFTDYLNSVADQAAEDKFQKDSDSFYESQQNTLQFKFDQNQKQAAAEIQRKKDQDEKAANRSLDSAVARREAMRERFERDEEMRGLRGGVAPADRQFRSTFESIESLFKLQQGTSGGDPGQKDRDQREKIKREQDALREQWHKEDLAKVDEQIKALQAIKDGLGLK